MRKFLIGLTVFLAVTLGCANLRPVQAPVPTKPVKVSIDVNDKECAPVQEEKKAYREGVPKVSALSFIHDDVGYVKIFSGISVADGVRLWNDLTIFNLVGVKKVVIYLNSPGGGAFDGIALAYHLMKAREEGMFIEIHAAGIVASAAVPILAVGSKRYALRGTIFMVHEAALWKWPGRETASDIRAQNELMNLLREEYLGIMADQTTTDYDTWEGMEGRTTWFGTKKAKDLGLIDVIE